MKNTLLVPVMTLADCVFLPQQLLPLRIFEPRYQRMLKAALATNQMFAVSQLDKSKSSKTKQEQPYPFTCVGRITGHVELDDGTHQIILEGLRRAKVHSISHEGPYPLLEISPVVDEDEADSIAFTREIARTLAFTEHLLSDAEEDVQPLLDRFRGLANKPGALADAVAGHLVAETDIRRELLECLSPIKRIAKVAEVLSALTAQKDLDDEIKPPNLGLN
jgi:ATP-dependent Lon protease